MFSPTYIPHFVMLWFAFGALSAAALLAVSWNEWHHAVKSHGYDQAWDIWIRTIPIDSPVNACPLWRAILGFLSGPSALIVMAFSIVQVLWLVRKELAS